jgi:dTDP-4-amino-4,6-dideoxygalactose transaminase
MIRRYFYSPHNNLNFTKNYTGNTPIGESISKRILYLPQFHEMTRTQQDFVIEKINNA